MFKKGDKFLSCRGFQILPFLVAASIPTSCSRNTVYCSLEKKWKEKKRNTTNEKLHMKKRKKVRRTKNGKWQLHIRDTKKLYAAPCHGSTLEEKAEFKSLFTVHKKQKHSSRMFYR